LKGLGLEERGLDGMELLAGGEAFDRDDLLSGRVHGIRAARPYGPAVEKDAAGAALSLAAAVLRAREKEPLAEDGEEALLRCRVDRMRNAVDVEDQCAHGASRNGRTIGWNARSTL